MTHDANFRGDHLRLAAYLRVVQNGMPDRPSRFRRRVRPHEAHDRSASHQPIRTSSLSEGRDDVPSAEVVTEDAVNILQPNTTPKEPITQDDDYDIPRSPTPPEPHLSSVVDDYMWNTHDSHVPTKTCSKTILINDPGQDAGTFCAFEVKKGSHQTPRSSYSQKRRLLVNGLALLRTTTLDGLPDPCDANAVSVYALSLIDPIEDNQASLLSEQIKCGEKAPTVCENPEHFTATQDIQAQDATPKSVLLSHPTERAKKSRHLARLLQSPTQAHRKPATLCSSTQSSLQAAFDGFIGSELELKSKKRPNQRERTTMKKTNVIITRELTLISGVLPEPAIEDHEARIPTTHLDQLDLNPRQISIGTNRHMVTSGPNVSPSSQSVDESEQWKGSRSRVCERMIENQLSSITAPPRRFHTESSDSEAATEAHFMNGQSDDDSDYDHNVRSAHFVRSSTLADDCLFRQRKVSSGCCRRIAYDVDEE